MGAKVISNPWIWILVSFFVLVNVADALPTDFTLDSILNRTTKISHNIYDPAANRTKDFVADVSDSINHFLERNETGGTTELTKNCSIVIGGALAAAVIGTISIGLLVPLVLCVLGFTCWGIMAGSAAACCQSNIGNVPAGSCFACFQSLGAGGGLPYLIFACIVGIPLGLYVGGFYARFVDFSSPKPAMLSFEHMLVN